MRRGVEQGDSVSGELFIFYTLMLYALLSADREAEISFHGRPLSPLMYADDIMKSLREPPPWPRSAIRRAV